MIAKRFRIKDRTLLDNYYRKSKFKVNLGNITVYRVDSFKLSNVTFSVIISKKKVRLAVKRNYIRRIVYQLCREVIKSSPEIINKRSLYILIVNSELSFKDLNQIKDGIKNVLINN